MTKEKIKSFFEIFLEKIKQNVFLIFCIALFISGLLIEDIFIRQKSKAVFCDVGQGDGALINLGKEQILIDGGPDNKFVGCIGKYMPYFDRTIEYLIISHPDKDHFVGAVEILRRYNIEKVFLNGDESEIPEYKEFLKLAQGKLIVADKDSDFKIGKAKIDFIHLGKYKNSNDNSLIFRFEYGAKSVLFTGDASVKVEKELIEKYHDLNNDLNHDILKLGHHGSKTSSAEEFLRAVNPELAIISVGADNKFGHPSYRVIKRLERLGIKYKRTDEVGNIIINFQ